MAAGSSVEVMEKRVFSREDFRRLPPRVTPEQMVVLQPVLHLLQDPREGTDDEWRIRLGWTV
jgi:hypothetical protein